MTTPFALLNEDMLRVPIRLLAIALSKDFNVVNHLKYEKEFEGLLVSFWALFSGSMGLRDIL